MKGDFFIARNKEMRSWIGEVVNSYRLPFKVMLQPMFPDKSPEQLAYLFGVVCKRVADATGHAPGEVYHAYKEHFNLEYSEGKDGVWRLRYKGASEFDTIDFNQFAMMIRADAVLELGINIELPNETWNNELDFSKDDKIETGAGRSEGAISIRVPKLSYRVRTYRKIG